MGVIGPSANRARLRERVIAIASFRLGASMLSFCHLRSKMLEQGHAGGRRADCGFVFVALGMLGEECIWSGFRRV
ncbi:hypothetical protein L596_023726 [Steinernema carpocapsae]|uniref:Uncharacterized protein n=1 Tax=Steinernema carpocapsae TaxID=34508 RepID=A0A4U5MEH9_STECR|nr:hypothetical protein L596_023726 [Steinernema carpocapsae]